MTTMTGSGAAPATVRLLGGPTALVEVAGVRFLTDPTFDPPGPYEDDGVTVVSKLTGPAVPFDALAPVDVVLLSHDQHPDNLDAAGRAVLPQVPLVVTTPDGATRLGANAVGLAPWSRATLARGVEVVAVPARHGPGPDAERVSGEVTGFVVLAPGDVHVYISGDNTDPDVVAQVVDRFGHVDVALLFGGGASVPFLFDGRLVTMTNEQLAQASTVLGAARVIPVHAEGWSHYTQDRDLLRDAFHRQGADQRLCLLEPGGSVTIAA